MFVCPSLSSIRVLEKDEGSVASACEFMCAHVNQHGCDFVPIDEPVS